QLDIVERQRFSGAQAEMDEYLNHLQSSTYVLCPRGSENYSYRMYETLSLGRVPVIIDTDTVLPKEIKWEKFCVIIPYNRIENIYDFIVEDYYSRTGDEFLLRQQDAFSAMAELHSM